MPRNVALMQPLVNTGTYRAGSCSTIDGPIGRLRQFQESREFGSVKKEGAVFDGRAERYDKSAGPLLGRHHAGGFIAKFLGDGVLVYFGYPQASEDAAELAVTASLRAIAVVRALPAVNGQALATRIGIATGPVDTSDRSDRSSVQPCFP